MKTGHNPTPLEGSCLSVAAMAALVVRMARRPRRRRGPAGDRMSEYQPGDVCVATVRGVPGVRVFAVDNARPWVSANCSHHSDDNVTDVRPLVVLDLSASPFPGNTDVMVRALRKERTLTGTWLADQIEAQTMPPKIPEPIALGAVVEDAQGQRWVRASTFTTVRHWRGCDDSTQGRERWENIDAVRVLSEGVQP